MEKTLTNLTSKWFLEAFQTFILVQITIFVSVAPGI